MSGKLFIVSAPSGTGKTTILKKVMAEIEGLAFSISHTTRVERESEQDGRDYFFVDKDNFKKMIAADGFLEWALVHDNYYGTALSPLKQQFSQGYDIILDIDVQGAEIVRKADLLPAVHIFIAPPSLTELEQRLRGRGTETESSVIQRLKNARKEMQQHNKYEYLVVNDQVESAVRMLSAIIYAERSRGRRTLQGSPTVMRMDT